MEDGDVTNDYDVIIVGCGPVGALSACILGNYGCKVLVLERDESVYSAPRAVALDDATIRLLGIADPQLAAWLHQHVLRSPVDVRTGLPFHPADAAASAAKGGSWGPLAAARGLWPLAAVRGLWRILTLKASYSLVGPSVPYSYDGTGPGAGLLGAVFGWKGPAAVMGGGYPDVSFLHQPALELRLRAYAASEHLRGRVQLLQGAEVTGLVVATEEGDSGVTVTVTQQAGQQRQQLRQFTGRYVLGCDGGASFVRKAFHVPFEGTSYPDEPWIVVDLELVRVKCVSSSGDGNGNGSGGSSLPRASQLARTAARVAEQWTCFNFICDPARPFVHVPLPGAAGSRRFEFILNRGEAAGDMLQPHRIRQLLQSVGVEHILLPDQPAVAAADDVSDADVEEVTAFRVVRSVVYTFHARRAAQWVAGHGRGHGHGRVCLAGDAAHCMPPFRGQGMCSGLKDAANVCWKVATALQLEHKQRDKKKHEARVTQALLASYQPEREGHLVQVIAVTVAMGSLIMLRHWLPVLLRNAGLCALYYFPLTQPLAKEPFSPPVGFHAGSFDFHTRAGTRWWRAAAAAGASKSSNSNAGGNSVGQWVLRDAMAGMPVPNFNVLMLSPTLSTATGAATGANADAVTVIGAGGPAAAALADVVHVPLDTALWHCARGQATPSVTEATTVTEAPRWVLLLPPYASASSALDADSEACLQRLAASPLYRLQVVQLLPASGFAHRVVTATNTSKCGSSDSSGNTGSVSRVYVGDADARFHYWMSAAHTGGVLLRPDRFVYGAYTAAELPAVLQVLAAEGSSAAALAVRRRPSYLLPLALAVLWRLAIVAAVAAAYWYREPLQQWYDSTSSA